MVFMNDFMSKEFKNMRNFLDIISTVTTFSYSVVIILYIYIYIHSGTKDVRTANSAGESFLLLSYA